MNENIEKSTAVENQNPVNFEYAIPEPEKFGISVKDTVFALILLGLSVITSSFGIFGGFKSGFTVSILLLLSSVTVYLLPARKKIKLFPLACMLLSICVSLSFTFTSNSAVRFWSFISVLLLCLVWFTSLHNSTDEKGDLGIFKNIFLPLFKGGIGNIPISVKSLLSQNEKSGKNFGRAMAGIALSCPVLLVIVPLLMCSDAAFSGMVEMLFGDLFLTVFKIILGIIIGIVVISYSLSLKKQEPCGKSDKQGFEGIEIPILISFLSVISVCYLAYLFSQLAYFFSAFSGFLPEDYEFTVSAYARRGFFEMTVIAALNFGIIFLTLLLSRKKDGKSCMPIRIICSFIGAFTLIIIATALSKMFLYIDSFGMTRLRLQTGAFMIFLAVVFISLILRLYFPRVRVIRVAFIMSALVLAVLGTFNVNKVAASYNYDAYKSGRLEEIDVYTIYELDAEGVPYLIKLAEDENFEVSESASNYLYSILEYDYNLSVTKTDGGYSVEYENRRNNLGASSLPESIADKALKEYVENNRQEIINRHENAESGYSDIDYMY